MTVEVIGILNKNVKIQSVKEKKLTDKGKYKRKKKKCNMKKQICVLLIVLVLWIITEAKKMMSLCPNVTYMQKSSHFIPVCRSSNVLRNSSQYGDRGPSKDSGHSRDQQNYPSISRYSYCNRDKIHYDAQEKHVTIVDVGFSFCLILLFKRNHVQFSLEQNIFSQ